MSVRRLLSAEDAMKLRLPEMKMFRRTRVPPSPDYCFCACFGCCEKVTPGVELFCARHEDYAPLSMVTALYMLSDLLGFFDAQLDDGYLELLDRASRATHEAYALDN